MAHKVHPKIFRVRELADWNSRWFDKKHMSRNLEEDFKLRTYIQKKLGKIGAERVEIERFPGKIKIIISSSRPGLIIGRGGQGVETLRQELAKIIEEEGRTSAKGGAIKKEIRIEIVEIKNPWTSAAFAAEWASQQIEKRVAYRRVLKQTLEKIMAQKGVQGCRCEVAGRLDGSEIARREWLKHGRLPRQTLRSDIDYAQAEAFCTYGTVGVKVWIYKGERF